MNEAKLIVALALASSGLLASCGGPGPATSENEAVRTESNAPENAGEPAPGQAQRAEEGNVDTVLPPDAVSHPDGYLPPAPAAPAPSAPEPAMDPPSSRESPPATEDQYMRNKQTGG